MANLNNTFQEKRNLQLLLMSNKKETNFLTDKQRYNKTDQDPFDDLPDEILLTIFSFLPPTKIVLCSCSNVRFNNLTNDWFVWRNFYEKNFKLLDFNDLEFVDNEIVITKKLGLFQTKNRKKKRNKKRKGRNKQKRKRKEAKEKEKEKEKENEKENEKEDEMENEIEKEKEKEKEKRKENEKQKEKEKRKEKEKEKIKEKQLEELKIKRNPLTFFSNQANKFQKVTLQEKKYHKYCDWKMQSHFRTDYLIHSKLFKPFIILCIYSMIHSWLKFFFFKHLLWIYCFLCVFLVLMEQLVFYSRKSYYEYSFRPFSNNQHHTDIVISVWILTLITTFLLFGFKLDGKLNCSYQLINNFFFIPFILFILLVRFDLINIDLMKKNSFSFTLLDLDEFFIIYSLIIGFYIFFWKTINKIELDSNVSWFRIFSYLWISNTSPVGLLLFANFIKLFASQRKVYFIQIVSLNHYRILLFFVLSIFEFLTYLAFLNRMLFFIFYSSFALFIIFVCYNILIGGFNRGAG
ncbi:sh3 domain-binding glutamic acid-rich-like protein [Anaeramoeba flamelloides]|uniref:Sh3 domain-binding glutamic acid-rich-like protein n=1 Tax=Anaeramoeba flamelloides TaxID=1746091 RepID=A0ABQ8YBL2_9EUKA|nr:sh3 domain-binding glutamic acid-rich-like protein [Anaeramoeba flamelloides]